MKLVMLGIISLMLFTGCSTKSDFGYGWTNNQFIERGWIQVDRFDPDDNSAYNRIMYEVSINKAISELVYKQGVPDYYLNTNMWEAYYGYCNNSMIYSLDTSHDGSIKEKFNYREFSSHMPKNVLNDFKKHETNMVSNSKEDLVVPGSFDDISNLLQSSKASEIDNTKWLFIVAIEDYEFTAPVKYSTNSAIEFQKVIQKRLGISEKNTRTLLDNGATSAKINYELKDMLRRVKKGDIVYFYYSGHGIPVPAQDNAPYMLAQDMNPAYIDDDRFKLQNIYKQLSNSKASQVIAFIDSCFSGGTDNQALIKGVAATRIKPKEVTFNKTKMIVISAGSETQYSNKYDEKSNRLFSYYIMRGLIQNNTDMQRLYDYVKSNVQEKSYEMGASYEQVPVYDGNIKLKL